VGKSLDDRFGEHAASALAGGTLSKKSLCPWTMSRCVGGRPEEDRECMYSCGDRVRVTEPGERHKTILSSIEDSINLSRWLS
jgi:hypothetical protein